jgi:uncharacterized repeat protein (TIGR01451 family)
VDLGIVSITPDVRHARVGDYVTFTIVAKNFGPDVAELFVNTTDASESLTFGSSSSANCGVINGPAPQPGIHGNDGSWCEHGLAQPGDIVTDALVMQIAPTSAGYASDTACAWSPEEPVGYADPTNGCATATVKVDRGT